MLLLESSEWLDSVQKKLLKWTMWNDLMLLNLLTICIYLSVKERKTKWIILI
jgi:hypothetical protein